MHSLIHIFLDWLENKLHIPNFAETYLSQSIDRADFSHREKILQQKGLL